MSHEIIAQVYGPRKHSFKVWLGMVCFVVIVFILTLIPWKNDIIGDCHVPSGYELVKIKGVVR